VWRDWWTAPEKAPAAGTLLALTNSNDKVRAHIRAPMISMRIGFLLP
jgi:hypothetical protein